MNEYISGPYLYCRCCSTYSGGPDCPECNLDIRFKKCYNFTIDFINICDIYGQFHYYLDLA